MYIWRYNFGRETMRKKIEKMMSVLICVLMIATTFAVMPAGAAPPPAVDANGPYGTPADPFYEGDLVNFNATIINGNPLDYQFRWDVNNDGQFDGPGTAPDFWGPKGVTNYTYQFRDNYIGQAMVEAWDGVSGALEDYADVHVENVPPDDVRILPTPGEGYVGQQIEFDARFWDPGLDDSWEYRWDFGDGTSTGWEELTNYTVSSGGKILFATTWSARIGEIIEEFKKEFGYNYTEIDEWDWGPLGHNSPPPLALMMGYDVIVVGTNYFTDSTICAQMGDNLADYVDAGGNVVQMWASFYVINSSGITGRWTDENYNPIDRAVIHYGYQDLGYIYDVTHPLITMDSENEVDDMSAYYIHNSYSENTYAERLIDYTAQGDRVLCSYTDVEGNPEGDAFHPNCPESRIVGLSYFPVSSHCTGDYMTLMANAVRWANQNSGKMYYHLPTIIHSYTHSGTYTVTLEVRDDDGGIGSGTYLFDVPLQPPVADAGPYQTAFLGYSPITFNGSNSYDLDGTIMSYSWDFGDNTSYTETPSNYPDGNYDGITEHVYTIGGLYLVTLTVTDNDNLTSSDTCYINVIDVSMCVPTDYDTIQEAIDHASPGDRIGVVPGIYLENIIVNKTLTLIGWEKETTIIDGNGSGTVVHITANDVTIYGFTIKGGDYGIYSDHINGSYIHNNLIIENNDCGLHLDTSINDLIKWNIISRNNQDSDDEGFGIYAIDSHAEGVQYNEISYNEVGAKLVNSWLWGCVNWNQFYNNYIGIDYDPEPLEIEGNVFINNTIAIKIAGDDSPVLIANNTISGSQIGIHVVSGSPLIVNNVIENNTYGIYVESDSPIIDGNTFSNNQYAVYYLNDATPIITNNIFTDNDVDVHHFIQAQVDIDPDTLNLKSKGRWVTCYVELPGDLDVNEIDISSLRISKINDYPVDIPVEVRPTGIEDNDGDGIFELMVKFDRSEVQDIVGLGENELILTGQLNDGSELSGSDSIRVKSPP
jgi:parallel beta-helix repeat protein